MKRESAGAAAGTAVGAAGAAGLVVACAACCAAPIIGVIAAVGGFSAIGAAFFPWLLIVAIAASALAIVFAIRRRRSVKACDSTDQTADLGMPSTRAPQ